MIELDTMSMTLTRQELYDRVWAEPVYTLAKEFGLSNVGLGKACRRHNIPVPPRGYWARKSAGQKMRQPPLPPPNGRETVTFQGSSRADSLTEEQTRAVHPLIAFEMQPENKITVPDDLRVRHQATAQTKEYWAAQKRGEVQYIDNKLPRLNIRVSKEILPRVFWLLQALFAELERRGHKVAATEEGKTILSVLGEPLEVSLREPSKQVRHVHGQGDRRREEVFLEQARAVRSRQLGHTGLAHRERLGRTAHLEGRQDPAARGHPQRHHCRFARRRVAQEGATSRARTRTSASRGNRASTRSSQTRQRYRQDRARIRRFERLRDACRDHQHLRAFLKQLRASIGHVEPETEVAQWLEWENGYVNQLDPLEQFRNPASSRGCTTEPPLELPRKSRDRALRTGIRNTARTRSCRQASCCSTRPCFETRTISK